MDHTPDDLLSRVRAGENLSAAETAAAVRRMTSGSCDEAWIADFLTALASKGETPDEVAGAAEALRFSMTPIHSRHTRLLDTCGAGGVGSHLFNISTTAALVVAACGVPVAKHGNRSVTSRSGSGDVLAELGVNISASIAQVERCLDELGLCFCFAPLMHPAMKHVSAVRKRLGIRTVFNILGPLANPARATHQLVGAGRGELRTLLAEALARLGTQRALVVTGEDGLGEATLAGATHVAAVSAVAVNEFELRPEDFGIATAPLDGLQIRDAADSAAIIRSVLANHPGPALNIVILNAALGLMAFDETLAPRDAAHRAAEAIHSGAAAGLLQRLAALSHE